MFDHIPAGKKQVKDEMTGEWKLVDMNSGNVADLEAMLEEEKSKNSCLETEMKSVQEQFDRMKEIFAATKIEKDRISEILKLDEKSYRKLVSIKK